jgi:subtilisin family serine protease
MRPNRFEEQLQLIQEAMPLTPLAMGPDGGQPQFLYERGCVLARGEDAGAVVEAVRGRFRDDRTRMDRVRADERDGRPGDISGMVRVRVGDPAGGAGRHDADVADALVAVAEAGSRAGRPLASRHHIMTITVNACPADEPLPLPQAERPNPDRTPDTRTGPRPSVLVIDTGLVHDYTQQWWAPQVVGDLRNDPTGTGGGSQGRKRESADGVLREYVGHGTFIAGLVASVAPHTRITVRNSLADAGAVTVKDLGQRLFEAVAGGWPDVISLSAGTQVGTDEVFTGLAPFMSALKDHGTVLVAAAGNNGTHDRFWPAAYAADPGYRESVVSVGALRADGESGACFSNHGPWVRVYAPGERLTGSFTGSAAAPVPYVYQHSTFTECRYGFDYRCTCRHLPHVGRLSLDAGLEPGEADSVRFEGMAQWSGTSFATPLVAGLIADHMAAHAQATPRDAAREVLAQAKERAEFWGAQVPVLRPANWSPVRGEEDLPPQS